MSHMDDLNCMRLAYFAASKSNDLSTQNGAVLFNPDTGTAFCTGINHIAKESCHKQDRFERPLKYQWTEHAERHAILKAARYGQSTRGKHLYCCWAACADCARAIAEAGITKLIRHSHPHHADRSDWLDSIKVGDEIMRERGVEIVTVDFKVGYKILFNGKMVDV